MTLPSGYWHELTTEDLAEVDPERTVALLPVSAIEQHGPHLPLYTDACIAEGIVAETLRLLDDDASLLVLPALPIGDSAEHSAYPGTLALSSETLIRVWRELGASVARAGVRKLIFLNTHGGQPQIADIVALDLRRAHGMLAVKANYFAFGVPHELFDDEELDHGIHGGAVETSMMLHLRPDLVRTEALDNFEPLSLQMAADYRHLGPEGPIAFGWTAQDMNPAGVVGDATQAQAEKGRKVVQHVGRCLSELVGEVARFPLANLRAGPLDPGGGDWP
jgi:creatinine amidohydrolase